MNKYGYQHDYNFRNELKWKKIFGKDGELVYEGYTYNDKPCGLGTTYYLNGNKYQEGIFDIKGLVQGKEYYPNGNLRFEGTYQIHHAYGPNYPLNGNYYDKKGELKYSGHIQIERGGVGYPKVKKPNFGSLEHKVDINYLIWDDIREYMD